MAVLARIQRTGLRNGFTKGSTTWLVLGISAWGFRFIQRQARRKPEILIREELRPGDRIIIANDAETYD